MLLRPAPAARRPSRPARCRAARAAAPPRPIDDAVHLAGQADAADVRKFLQQPVQQGQGCVLDAAGILLALPRLPGDGSAARYGARAQEPAVRVQHGGGDRRRPEIKAQMIHIDPSSVFQWE